MKFDTIVRGNRLITSLNLMEATVMVFFFHFKCTHILANYFQFQIMKFDLSENPVQKSPRWIYNLFGQVEGKRVRRTKRTRKKATVGTGG